MLGFSPAVLFPRYGVLPNRLALSAVAITLAERARFGCASTNSLLTQSCAAELDAEERERLERLEKEDNGACVFGRC
jgi:hypothetical protein